MKHTIVIGGTRGIGAGIVKTLLAKGWRVTATGVGADEVAAFKAAHGSDCDALQLDITDQAAVDALFSPLDRLDGLVNCAGILARGAEYNIEMFEQVIAINLTGTMRTALAAKPHLEKTGGAIVNTASMLSFFGGPLVPAYSASKGGVAQLTKALAGRWASDGVRVNAVAPGWIETEMTEPLREDPARNAPIVGRTPMARWGLPEEVGAMVAFLLSEEASFITGSIYNVDGGYAAM